MRYMASKYHMEQDIAEINVGIHKHMGACIQKYIDVDNSAINSQIAWL